MNTLARHLLLGALLVGSSAPARPCSMFTAHDDSRVLVGDNEDYYSEQVSSTYRALVHFVPATADQHGYVMWGWAFAPNQGGMNDQGLFWDGFTTPSHAVASSGEPWTAQTLDLMLQSCSTVAEALAFLQLYNPAPLGTAQLFIVDAHGDSAIYDGQDIVPASADYQVCTNFLQTHPELGAWPCQRYNTLMAELSDGFELTVEYFTRLAEAAQQWNSSAQLYTRYTVIAELVEGRFHLTYDLDWQHPRTFVLADELAAGERTVDMSDLFATAPETDAGVADGGAADGGDAAGGVDAGPDANDTAGGCGCAAPRRLQDSSAGTVALIGGVALLARARRRRSWGS